jgi:hypothetical protein
MLGGVVASPRPWWWFHHHHHHGGGRCHFSKISKKAKQAREKLKRTKTCGPFMKKIVDWTTDETIEWDDRPGLQNKWTLAEKGWEVQVEWKMTTTKEQGIGVFAQERIEPGTILRRGRLGYNLVQFHNVDDIEAFVAAGSGGAASAAAAAAATGDPADVAAVDAAVTTSSTPAASAATGTSNTREAAKWRYVSDYLWGFHYRTNEGGWPYDEHSSLMFVGMWMPGNGLNHSMYPNTIYRVPPPPGVVGADVRDKHDAIQLVATREIFEGEQLYDDYRRHGKSPLWLQPLIRRRNLQLNFKDCNDFVVPVVPTIERPRK